MLDNGGPEFDGTEARGCGSVHGDGVIALIIFLEIKCDGDSVGFDKVWVIMVDFGVAFEEADILEFGLAFSSDSGVYLHERMAKKKAPLASCPMAMSFLLSLFWRSWQRNLGVIAF